MRSTNAALIGFLIRKLPYWSADLFTLTPRVGSPLHLTSADRDITVGAITYSARGPTISRTRWSVKNTLDVPEMEIKLGATGSDLTLGNIKALAVQGFLDGAVITLDRVFMPSFGDTSLETVRLFGGNVAGIEISPAEVVVSVKGANNLLQQYLPRNLFSVSCVHALYDSGCGLARGDYTTSYTVGAGSASKVVVWSSPPANPAYYSYGVVAITSGAGAGQVRTVLSATTAGLLIAYPLVTLPSPGDTFDAYYGCSKTRGANAEAAPNCTTPFANTANFRGFPFIPPAETSFLRRSIDQDKIGRRYRTIPASFARSTRVPL